MSATWKNELGAAVAAAGRVVVLGVGNPDKGDDGAGPAVAAGLLARSAGQRGAGRPKPHLIIDGRETPESRTGEIRKFGPDLTIIVDATIGGHPAGTVFIVEKEEIADEGVSTHTISLRYLVRYLEESIGSKVLVLGIEPSSLELGSLISIEVRHAVNEIVSELFDTFGNNTEI